MSELCGRQSAQRDRNARLPGQASVGHEPHDPWNRLSRRVSAGLRLPLAFVRFDAL